MPTFTAPAPFCPSEAGKPKEAPAQEIEKPAPPKEEKKEKGILAKIKKLFWLVTSDWGLGTRRR